VSADLAVIRAELARRLAELDEADVRAVAWLVEQLPATRLAAELRALDDQAVERSGSKVQGGGQYPRQLLCSVLGEIGRLLRVPGSR
jgi:hypothetical protein